MLRRQLKRRYQLVFFQKLPSCLVGIEACASSHHWSRELPALVGRWPPERSGGWGPPQPTLINVGTEPP